MEALHMRDTDTKLQTCTLPLLPSPTSCSQPVCTHTLCAHTRADQGWLTRVCPLWAEALRAGSSWMHNPQGCQFLQDASQIVPWQGPWGGGAPFKSMGSTSSHRKQPCTLPPEKPHVGIWPLLTVLGPSMTGQACLPQRAAFCWLGLPGHCLPPPELPESSERTRPNFKGQSPA